MSAIIVPRRRTWTHQPPENIGIDRAAAAKYGAIYLSLANHPRICHDLVAEKNIVNPGGVANSSGGLVWTYNGSQQSNLAFALPNGDVFPGSVLIGARVLASAAQAATPGHAFGLSVGSGTQSGIGVGFDSTGTKIGAAALTGNGAYLGTYSPCVQNRFYDVFINITPSASVRAWIDGQPAATGQASASLTGWNFSGWNEISIGAQHRSSGFLRNFKGSIEWASLIYVADQSQITDDLVADLYRSGYPYNLLKRRRRPLIFDLGAAGTLNASASGSATASGQADLSAQVALASIGISQAGASAAPSIAVPLSAIGFSEAQGTLTPSVTVSVAAQALAAAAGQAGISADITLQAAAAAEANGLTDLAIALQLIAAGAAEAGASAQLSGGAAGALTAAGGAVADASALLKIHVALQGGGLANADGSALASTTTPGAMTAVGGAESSAQANLTTTVTMTVAGFVQAMGAGTWQIDLPLSAFGNANVWGSAIPTVSNGSTRPIPVGFTVVADRKFDFALDVQPRSAFSVGVAHG